jgi:hypothetical protein
MHFNHFAKLRQMSFINNDAGNFLHIAAAISLVVGPLNPLLALVRWVQEKSIGHRCREEMARSREILAFIQVAPEMASAVGCREPAVLERARSELSSSIEKLNTLLEKKAAKAAPPVEIAWPRRLLLLYVPRSWGATILHSVYLILITTVVLAAVNLGYSDETDAFQWSEYAHILSNPVLLMVALWFVLCLGLLWYAATTKDRWDKTLPVRGVDGDASFLRATPDTIHGLLARMLLAYASFDFVSGLITAGLLRNRPELWSASIRPLLSAPRPTLWAHIINWTAAILCLVLAYLWARAEDRLQGRKLWVPFPHNFRALYVPSGWRETLAQIAIPIFLIELFVYLSRVKMALALEFQLLPTEELTGFFIGSGLSIGIETVLTVLLPIYASYRFAFITRFLRRESESVRVGDQPLLKTEAPANRS